MGKRWKNFQRLVFQNFIQIRPGIPTRNERSWEIKLAFYLKNQSKSFSFWDFTTFGLLLVVSTVIGIYFGWKDRKNKDDNNYGKFLKRALMSLDL